MASMKAEYRAEIKRDMELSAKFKVGYDSGYLDGCMDGYDRALKDIQKLRGVAIEELLGGFGHELDKAER